MTGWIREAEASYPVHQYYCSGEGYYYIVTLWTGNDFHERSTQCTLSMPFVEFETVANSQVTDKAAMHNYEHKFIQFNNIFYAGVSKLGKILGPILSPTALCVAMAIVLLVCYCFKKNSKKIVT